MRDLVVRRRDEGSGGERDEGSSGERWKDAGSGDEVKG